MEPHLDRCGQPGQKPPQKGKHEYVDFAAVTRSPFAWPKGLVFGHPTTVNFPAITPGAPIRAIEASLLAVKTDNWPANASSPSLMGQLEDARRLHGCLGNVREHKLAGDCIAATLAIQRDNERATWRLYEADVVDDTRIGARFSAPTIAFGLRHMPPDTTMILLQG